MTTKYEENLAAFKVFHKTNPQVAAELEKLALRLKQRGKTRYSIAGLFEVIRFRRALRTTGKSPFKLSNNHKPFYARLLMQRNPELQGFFEVKQQTTKGKLSLPDGDS